ncbi:hypothetical protein B0J13DRAFT_640765 [Dactylonectria estremocensis]|uniref:Alcohol dehydrogenase iron-type/glycerol dehydrogenase GldA domain-containing protein n=1 Tax=Dactylonectria estremocensis TaxID=1079267 RepID=A0A9P9IZW0_9HYPO|nr:hypothetical protein B0J13DRAFT_640765 [Dactylonectria estremocensis]
MKSSEYVGAAYRVLFGSGTIQQLPSALEKMNAKAMWQTESRPAAVVIFSETTMHTPTSATDRAVSVAKEKTVDSIVSVGGGSTIGLGKAVSIQTDLSHLCIPTTYAGSEMTPILGEMEDRRKVTRRDPRVLPQGVVYDIDLTRSLPIKLSIYSGINAIAHAVEALYASNTNPIIKLMTVDGIRNLAKALPLLHNDDQNSDARYEALYGAWLCAICLGSVDIALHHKLCHTLGGTFSLPHAETHVVVLPHAVAYSAPAVPGPMAKLASALPDSDGDAAKGITSLYRRLEIDTSLRAYGMPDAGVDEATELVMSDPYNNPRPLDWMAIRELIFRAWTATFLYAKLRRGRDRWR